MAVASVIPLTNNNAAPWFGGAGNSRYGGAVNGTFPRENSGNALMGVPVPAAIGIPTTEIPILPLPGIKGVGSYAI